jgi:hypothetical protein
MEENFFPKRRLTFSGQRSVLSQKRDVLGYRCKKPPRRQKYNEFWDSRYSTAPDNERLSIEMRQFVVYSEESTASIFMVEAKSEQIFRERFQSANLLY